MSEGLDVHKAALQDLDAINCLIERAVATWNLPERVKRLALPTYRYTPLDLQALTILAAYRGATLVGVAAWESTEPEASPGLALHGLFVDPQWWGGGIGTALLARVEQSAREQGFKRVIVKAQPGATGFFLRHGFQAATSADASGYAHTLSKSLPPAHSN